jgi:glycosyltransferase involved in cell wall biosynthesis
MKLSVIIPVYNVEPYVERCLLSVIEQDIPFFDYEIIVINDGTTDNSLVVVNEFAAKYDNIIVVSQENQGLGAARNKGLSLAKGEYVWFIDSDDWIAKNCLSKIMYLLNQDIDCLTFKYNKYSNSEKNQDFSLFFPGIKSGMNLTKTHKVSIPAPFTIIKRSIFLENNLTFCHGICYEDSELTPKLYFYAQKCVFLDEVCYYYFRRDGSIMSSFSLKKASDILFINDALLNFAEKTIKNQCERFIFYYWIGLNINILLFKLNQLSEDEARQFFAKFVQKRKMFMAMIRSGKLKYKIEGVLLLLSPRLTLNLYKLFFYKKNKKICR